MSKRFDKRDVYSMLRRRRNLRKETYRERRARHEFDDEQRKARASTPGRNRRAIDWEALMPQIEAMRAQGYTWPTCAKAFGIKHKTLENRRCPSFWKSHHRRKAKTHRKRKEA